MLGAVWTLLEALRRAAETLAHVTMGVRAIERQTAPLDETLQAVNSDLEAVPGAAWLIHRSAGGPHKPRRRWDDPFGA